MANSDAFEYFVVLGRLRSDLRQQQVSSGLEMLIDFLKSGVCFTRTGEVVEEFHEYVRPLGNPTLTAFCTELTGIEQTTVDSADPFPDVLGRVEAFLAKYDQQRSLVITCGDWDLKTMLPAQLAVSGCQTVPVWARRWCNLKIAFSQMSSATSNRAVGRHHSGIDDARNIASIVRRMMKDGIRFTTTSTARSVQISPYRKTPSAYPPKGGAKFSTTSATSATSKNPKITKNNPPAPLASSTITPIPSSAVANAMSISRPMVDIGANLSHKSFAASMHETLSAAKQHHVECVMVTGTSLRASRDAVTLCRKYAGVAGYPKLFCTVGVHPHEATQHLRNPKLVHELQALIESNRDIVVAVGETGLDFDRNFSAPADQERCFRLHCALAKTTKLPLFLHVRKADDRFTTILEEEFLGQTSSSPSPSPPVIPGVVHCFTSPDPRYLEKYLSLGLHIGITGWICDERPSRAEAGVLRQMLSSCRDTGTQPLLPLERLLIETDAPFLIPRNIPRTYSLATNSTESTDSEGSGSRRKKPSHVNQPAYLR
ncbi:hypothetical protein HK102_000163, partial [Quaeritorhiza haematococci]